MGFISPTNIGRLGMVPLPSIEERDAMRTVLWQLVEADARAILGGAR